MVQGTTIILASINLFVLLSLIMSSNQAISSRDPPPVPGNHPSTRKTPQTVTVPKPYSSRLPPPKTTSTQHSSGADYGNPNITIISAHPIGPDSKFILKAAPASEPVHSNTQHKPETTPMRPTSPPSDITLASIRNSIPQSSNEHKIAEVAHPVRQPPPKPPSLSNEGYKSRPLISIPLAPPQIPSEPPKGIPPIIKPRGPVRPVPLKQKDPNPSTEETVPNITNSEVETNETSITSADDHQPARQQLMKPRARPKSNMDNETPQIVNQDIQHHVDVTEPSSDLKVVLPKRSAPPYKPRYVPRDHNKPQTIPEDQNISENTIHDPVQPVARRVSPINPKIMETEPAIDITDITVSIQPATETEIPSKTQPPKLKPKVPPTKPKPSKKISNTINADSPTHIDSGTPESELSDQSSKKTPEQTVPESTENNTSHDNAGHRRPQKPPRNFDPPKEIVTSSANENDKIANLVSDEKHLATSSNPIHHGQSVYPTVAPVTVQPIMASSEVSKQGPPKPSKPEPPKPSKPEPPKPSKPEPPKQGPTKHSKPLAPIRNLSKEEKTDQKNVKGDDVRLNQYHKQRSTPSLPPRPDLGHPLYKYVCTEPHAFSTMNYTSENEDFLSLSNGEFLLLLEKYDKNWYIVMNESGEEGYVNAKCLKISRRLLGDSADGFISEEQAFAVACKDYRSNEPGDLNFKNHDAILLIRYVSDSWIEGKLENSDYVGIFPKEYVEIVTDISGGPPAPEDFISGPRAKAIYDFQETELGDLEFLIGDIIILTQDIGSGWMKGKLAFGNGQEGIFPLEFVNIIEPINAEKYENVNIIEPSPIKTEKFENVVFQPVQEPEPVPDENQSPQLEGETALAIYDYVSSEPGDLEFTEGDTIINISHINEDWLQGEINNKIGMFPAQYVEISSSNTTSKIQIVENCAKKSTTTTNDDLLPRAIALYDFDQPEDGDLCFKKDDVIFILDKVNEDWFEGELNGKFGNVPFNFVNIIQPLP